MFHLTANLLASGTNIYLVYKCPEIGETKLAGILIEIKTRGEWDSKKIVPMVYGKVHFKKYFFLYLRYYKF